MFHIKMTKKEWLYYLDNNLITRDTTKISENLFKAKIKEEDFQGSLIIDNNTKKLKTNVFIDDNLLKHKFGTKYTEIFNNEYKKIAFFTLYPYFLDFNSAYIYYNQLADIIISNIEKNYIFITKKKIQKLITN